METKDRLLERFYLGALRFHMVPITGFRVQGFPVFAIGFQTAGKRVSCGLDEAMWL